MLLRANSSLKKRFLPEFLNSPAVSFQNITFG
jgi:hypothetical protein